MTKMTVFDHLKVQNKILGEIWVSQSENLGIWNTFDCGIFSKNQYKDLQND